MNAKNSIYRFLFIKGETMSHLASMMSFISNNNYV